MIADYNDNLIRLVAVSAGTFYGQAMTAGDIYTIAGTTSPALNWPEAVAVDGHGNVVVADSTNQEVRVLAVTTGTFYGRAMKADHLYTVAGDGTAGYSGDGGAGTTAELDNPFGVAVDHSGNLVIGDMGNNRIRDVAG